MNLSAVILNVRMEGIAYILMLVCCVVYWGSKGRVGAAAVSLSTNNLTRRASLPRQALGASPAEVENPNSGAESSSRKN